MIPYKTDRGYRVFLTNAVVGRPAGPCTPTYGASQAPRININFVLPVHDLQVKVRSSVKKARDMHGKSLHVQREGGSSRFTLPRIDQYQVVDIEV